MASGIAETAKLIASLGFKDNFTPGAKKAMGTLGQLESTGYRVGQQVGKGLSNAATNIKRVGVVAGAGIAFAVHQGVENLALLEDATTSVDGAIKATGQTGKVTSQQVAQWANEIESSVQAAFDDKDITRNAATLIRYGKVTAANLKPALVVMTDLAAKTGSVDSASSLLAKALADPAKAAGKLSRVGVVLTKSQQDNIKAMVKAGKTAKAQAYLLTLLGKATKGAAAASKGPYNDALNQLHDVTEDATKALATGFLPIITKVSNLLSTELAKPETLNNIKSFGETLAGGLDSAINIAKNLPWAAIGDAFKVAGAGAKAVLTAFTSLPPWVQTAVLTGWGLNKLTGGALTGIIGELGKGLIKGVLGMNAGIVNIKAGVVTGAGGLPGAATGVAAGAAAGTGLALTTAIVAPVAVAAAGYLIKGQIDAQGDALRQQAITFAENAKNPDLDRAIDGLEATIKDMPTGNIFSGQNKAIDTLNVLIAERNRRIGAATLDRGGRGDAGTVANPNNMLDRGGRGDPVKTILDKGSRDDFAKISATVDTWGSQNRDEAAAVHASVDKGASAQTGAVNSAKFATVAATYGAAATVAGAIRANPPPIVNVDVSVTPAQIEKTTTIVQRGGPTQGSSGGGGGGGRIAKP